jgi:hypothetical protein
MAKTAPITIPSEPIGSIPRPADLIERVAKGDSEDPILAPLYADAIQDTIQRFKATGSPVVTDGEQRKYHNFCAYCVHGLPNTASDDFNIPFSGGHTRPFLLQAVRRLLLGVRDGSFEPGKSSIGAGAREAVNF